MNSADGADQFWRIIGSAGSCADPYDRVDVLHKALNQLSHGELIEFQVALGNAHRLLNTMSVLGAASALLGFVSEDVFTDVRGWIILRGRTATEAVAERPDSLADLHLTDQDELGAGEHLSFLPEQVHEERFSVSLCDQHPEADFWMDLNEPTGPDEPLTKKALRHAYPKCSSAKSQRLPLLGRFMRR